jgi:hypothetical protein
VDQYPKVLSEWETIYKALRQGLSLSRFGDGEIRLAVGPPAKPSKTQGHVPGLQNELSRMLRGKTHSLVCLPRISPTLPLYDKLWSKFLQPKWTKIIEPAEYGSSFITRPESAPEIDDPKYWDMISRLWAGRRVTLVIGAPDAAGKHYSLIEDDLIEAQHVTVIEGPERDAYAEIDHLDREIGPQRDRVVLLCLGATATCLAERCAARGVQALDLGHIGRHVRRWRASLK